MALGLGALVLGTYDGKGQVLEGASLMRNLCCGVGWTPSGTLFSPTPHGVTLGAPCAWRVFLPLLWRSWGLQHNPLSPLGTLAWRIVPGKAFAPELFLKTCGGVFIA